MKNIEHTVEQFTDQLGFSPIPENRVRRLFDIFFSTLFLCCAAPFLLLLAFLVKVTSRGPAIYKSKRLGQGGRVVDCLKFRTMYHDADARLRELLTSDPLKKEEWALYQKLKSDPRITPIGKFLRRTSFDEALQFWNVLQGDFSIVGPRPVVLTGPQESYLTEIQSIYGKNTAKILSVKPGITGIWQVSGRSEVSLEMRQEMEIEYENIRTFKTDLLMIAKTIPAVLFSKGAF